MNSASSAIWMTRALKSVSGKESTRQGCRLIHFDRADLFLGHKNDDGERIRLGKGNCRSTNGDDLTRLCDEVGNHAVNGRVNSKFGDLGIDQRELGIGLLHRGMRLFQGSVGSFPLWRVFSNLQF